MLSSAAVIGFACALMLLYGTAVFRQLRAGRRWSLWRSASFCCGITLIIIAAFPLSHYHHHSFSAHMTQHLLIGMLAPTFLVMAAPIKLLLRSLPQHAGKFCAQLFHNTVFRTWSHPVTAFILNFGGMFVLYLSPLYRASQESLTLHLVIHLHFLVAGFLFAWSLAGPDPHPGRPAFGMRIGVLFFAITCHGLFSKYMYIYSFPYDTYHSLEDIRAGAQLMYYGGDLAEVMLAILVFSKRSRRGRSHTKSSSALARVGYAN